MKNLVMVCLCIFVASCATSEKVLYERIQSNEQTSVKTNVEALSASKIIPLPKGTNWFPITGEDFDIEQSDPIFAFPDYLSNYKIFSFSGDIDDKFQIKVWSSCDCLGFDKRILVPVTYVFDETGKVIDYEVVGAKSDIGHIFYKVIGSFESSSKLFLFVGADNSRVGKTMGTGEAMVDGYKPTGIIVRSTSNPYGEFSVEHVLNPTP